MKYVFSYETICHILLHILFLFLSPFPPAWYLKIWKLLFQRALFVPPNVVCMTDEKEPGYFYFYFFTFLI